MGTSDQNIEMLTEAVNLSNSAMAAAIRKIERLESELAAQQDLKEQCNTLGTLLNEVYEWTLYKSTPWAIQTKKALDAWKGSEYRKHTSCQWENGNPPNGRYLITTIDGVVDVDSFWNGQWDKYISVRSWAELPKPGERKD